MKELFIIAGMPLADFPEHPSDQVDCKLSTCKYCEKQMWLSRKKRDLIIEMPDAFVICWHCLIKRAKNKEFAHCDIQRVDL